MRQFYTEPSQYFWTDDYGVTHCVQQGEGGEQGDALMPMLYSLGQHGALESIQDSLFDDEHFFAYLDGLYVVCSPQRVAPIFKIIAQALEEHARIQVHLGKTQVWNLEVIIHQDATFYKPLLSERTRMPECGEAKDLQRNRGSEFWASQSVTWNSWRLSFGRPQ